MICVNHTPIEDYCKDFGLFVKREDLCCPGGPNFSKSRGVYAHIAKRPEKFIGVLDTSHSQGGWAVARACRALGKQCINFYPVFKGKEGFLPPVQQTTRELGAQLLPLKAGRSAVLYHRCRAWMSGHPEIPPAEAYMMPNALKLEESVAETAAEVGRTFPSRLERSCMPVLVSASSGTIAAGVLRGLVELGWNGQFLVHLGYSRSQDAVRAYIAKMSTVMYDRVVVVDEGYSYADEARDGSTPPFACNRFYDLKAFRWWMAKGCREYGRALLWNVG